MNNEANNELVTEREMIEVNVTVKKVMFYDPEKMWGSYGIIPNTQKDKFELNNFGNVAITGNSAKLMEFEEYDLILEPSYSKRYGDGFKIVSVESKRPETIADQQSYVKAIVTENRYEEIIKVYPNHPLLDMFENDEIDFDKIKGFGEHTYHKVKQDLLNNLEIQEALVELKEFDITYEATRKLIEHFGSASTLIQRVRDNIYNLCKVDNFGFKKVDQYAMNRGDDPTSDNRIESAAAYILDQDANNGNSWMPKREFVDTAQEMLEIDERYIEDMVEKLEKEQAEDKDKRLDIYIEKNKIALSKNHFFESKIKDKLMELVSKPTSTYVDDVEKKFKDQEKIVGFTFTDEQKEAIKLAIDNNILAINGKGGVGKTAIVKGVIGFLNEYYYMSCALSGKAAQVLNTQGMESMTIHRMLGVSPEGFVHNADEPLPYDIVILDEASMANNYLFYSILIALKKDAKIIFVGDNGQLPSIGTGAVFDSILNSGRGIIPGQELTKVHRQAAKSGILSVANEIREGQQVTEKYGFEQETFGELRDMTIVPVDKETDIVDMIVNISKRNKDADLYNFQVITGLRERGDLSVKSLNIELQGVFNDLDKPFITRGAYDYRVGDKIIHNGNNYEAGEDADVSIFNGTMGKILYLEIDPDKTKNNHQVHINFENISETIIYSMEEMRNIELAYAITVHKSQGSTIKNVIFAFDFSSYMLLSREFVYTGITRASKGCIMICENNALHYAIEQTVGGTRRDFLGDMLIEESMTSESDVQ